MRRVWIVLVGSALLAGQDPAAALASEAEAPIGSQAPGQEAAAEATALPDAPEEAASEAAPAETPKAKKKAKKRKPKRRAGKKKAGQKKQGGAVVKAPPINLEATDPVQQFRIGQRYQFGRYGTPVNHVEAAKWYRKAAEQGHPKAQASLGMAYWFGRGVPKDLEQYVYWNRKAADQHHPRSQFEMGVSYRDGQGVERDSVEALKWLILSSQHGGMAASMVGGSLARRLTPQERKDARQRVSAWRDEHGLPPAAAKAAKAAGKPAKVKVPAAGSGATGATTETPTGS